MVMTTGTAFNVRIWDTISQEIDPFHSCMIKDRFKQKALCFALPAPAMAFFTITRISGTQNLEVGKWRRDRASYFMTILCSSAGSPDDLWGISHIRAVRFALHIALRYQKLPNTGEGL